MRKREKKEKVRVKLNIIEKIKPIGKTAVSATAKTGTKIKESFGKLPKGKLKRAEKPIRKKKGILKKQPVLQEEVFLQDEELLQEEMLLQEDAILQEEMLPEEDAILQEEIIPEEDTISQEEMVLQEETTLQAETNPKEKLSKKELVILKGKQFLGSKPVQGAKAVLKKIITWEPKGKQGAGEKKESRFWQMFRNAPISKKLTISHGIIIISTVVVTFVLLVALKGVEGYVGNMYTGPVVSSFYIGDIRYALADIPSVINNVRTQAEGTEVQEYIEEQVDKAIVQIDTDWAMIENAYTILKDSLFTEGSKEQLEKIRNLMKNVRAELDIMIAYMDSGDIEVAGYYYEGNVKRWLDSIHKDVENLTQEISVVSKDYSDEASGIALILILAGILMLIVVIIVVLRITRKVTYMISKPLEEVTEAARKLNQGNMGAYTEIIHESEDELGTLAEAMRGTMRTMEDYIKEISVILEQMAYGDLTKDFDEITDFHGDFSTIKESFVFILTEFNKTLTEINMVSTQVDQGADEIAAGANELAASTEEQASAVEELTATINAVASMALENAEHAEESYQGVMVSVSDAQSKRAQVEELQAEMQRIKDISGEIAKIITTIEDIADETGLLSLNASIEAARAGEAGRGFAVVADQIGKLATGSAKAAVSTKSLIEKTVAEIDKGSAITESTAAAFDSIIKQMTEFAGAAQGSKETAEEQASMLKQIEEGVSEVAAVTQENAASAEESLATSEELAARAEELAEQVRRFKLR